MAVQPLASQVGVAPACRALGVPRASFYRRQRPAPGHQQPRPTPARALRASERAHVLDVLASPRFVDRSPAEVVATLLDEGRYLCAERTMYRILAANQPVRERRNQRSHPCYTKPELVATGPNQTWSWDITRLRGPKSWTSFYLYVLLDIFSRYVVGWMVADRENAALAATLIEETCLKQGIEPQVLTLHSDRGAPMTSKCTAQLLADLGVTRSLSRPQVSDDNPFSEAQFKTLKYHPGFPGRFEDITAAIAFCRSFFPWYNTEHRHAGIAMLTPDDVHHHRAPDVLAKRGRTLQAAWALHPERFVHGTPKPAPLPEAVWINPPATSTTGENESVNRNRRCLKVVDRFRCFFKSFPHQPNCRPSVPAGLNQEIQDFALTVHGTPEIELPPSNYDDHLVQVPAFGRSWPPTLNPPRIGPTEFQDPSSNCLIRDVETTLGKQVLNVPIAQRETAIEPDGMLDDDRWKAVTTVGYLAHPETLKHRPCRSHAVIVTMPPGGT